MKPSGSRGREAVASALEQLRSWTPHPPDRRPAFDVVLANGLEGPSESDAATGLDGSAVTVALHALSDAQVPQSAIAPDGPRDTAPGKAVTFTSVPRSVAGPAADSAALGRRPSTAPHDAVHVTRSSVTSGNARSTALGRQISTASNWPRTIAAAAKAMRQGGLTSRALVEEGLRAVDAHDAQLHAVVHLMAEEALAEAAARDAEAVADRWRGPLHGIPVTVKDVIDVSGAPTRAGSAAFCRTPSEDAASVALLREAGAVVLAKVSTHEFALGVTTPQSRNPHDPTRIPGGSSGGSAIAVTMGMGLGSLATDTRASTRVPAALCGCVGLKPTFGCVPTRGVVPLSWTMDHVGQIARTVQDAALLLSAAAVKPTRDWTAAVGANVAAMRVGVPQATFQECEDAVATGVEAALKVLEGLGCTVSAAARPTEQDLAATNAAALLISRCEAAAFHRHLGTDRSLYWDEVADQLDAADRIAATDYIDAQRLRADLQVAFTALFQDHDVLAMPTTPCIAPPSADFARYLLVLSRNASPWSLTGFPALTLPCGASGPLPFGLQLVAPPWHESRLIALGTALDRAVGGGAL